MTKNWSIIQERNKLSEQKGKRHTFQNVPYAGGLLQQLSSTLEEIAIGRQNSKMIPNDIQPCTIPSLLAWEGCVTCISHWQKVSLL